MGYYDDYDTYEQQKNVLYVEPSNFKDKLSEKKDFNYYINRKTTNILKDKFNKVNNIDLNNYIYEKFISSDRRNDILEYKKYGLTSPQIYNIIYFYLLYNDCEKLDKKLIKNFLEKDVNYVKYEMEIIKHNGYTPNQYRELKDNSNYEKNFLNPDVYF